MKFVFLCDSRYVKGEVAGFVNNFPSVHELVVMSGEDLLQAKKLPEETFALLVDRTTWQKNFSLFRYFGLLPVLEKYPLGIVGRVRRQDSLKGRVTVRSFEFLINPTLSSEEMYSLIDRFIAAPPSGHIYPRGLAKV